MEVLIKQYDFIDLNTVYKEIGDELGMETTLKIYHMFKGTQVVFPTRLFSHEYLKKVIQSEYDGKNIKKLAIKYNYSERSIRRILKEK